MAGVEQHTSTCRRNRHLPYRLVKPTTTAPTRLMRPGAGGPDTLSTTPNLNGQDHPSGRLEQADGQNPVENQGLRKEKHHEENNRVFYKSAPNSFLMVKT